MEVRDIMTSELRTCRPEAITKEVASMMSDEDVGPIPVVEKGNLKGIITDSKMSQEAIEFFEERSIPVVRPELEE